VAVALVAGVVGGLVAVALAPSTPGAPDATAAPARVSAPIAVDSGPAGAAGDGVVARVARAVLPSVVRINRATNDRYHGSGNGSGVVYREDGLIVTNNHVVAESGGIEVVFADGATARGEIVGRDRLNDLAVVRVDRTGLRPMAPGRTRDLQVGDLAIAVGSPFGLDATVTAGVISALGRGVHAGAPDQSSVYLHEVIQTDAPINPGNSGGALVDGSGRLIGINSAILTAGQVANAGVGFAIPVDTVVDVADQLIAHGEVSYPLLGVRGGPVTAEVARRLGVDAGAWVNDVQPGTPADAAGLAADDVVVEVDGAPIASMQDLVGVVRDHRAGDRLAVTYVRDGRRHTVDVALAQRPGAAAQ
jgi:S1-C subfamily serine protease